MAWYLIKHRDNFTFTITIQLIKKFHVMVLCVVKPCSDEVGYQHFRGPFSGLCEWKLEVNTDIGLDSCQDQEEVWG
jgi:hypothetical protein